MGKGNDPLALNAAVPRRLNQDVLRILVSEQDVNPQFEWLKQRPFVQDRHDGWAYHDVVRAQMLRYKHLESPDEWSKLHGRLAHFYQERRDKIELDQSNAVNDKTWQSLEMEAMYHRLCQNPHRHITSAVNGFVTVQKNLPELAKAWLDTMIQASSITENPELENWARTLRDGFEAINSKQDDKSLAFMSKLIEYPLLNADLLPHVLQKRSSLYKSRGRVIEAIKDLDLAIEKSDRLSNFEKGMLYLSRGGARSGFFDDQTFSDLFTAAKMWDSTGLNAVFTVLRGIHLMLTARCEEAIEIMNGAISDIDDPDFCSDTLLLIGVSYFMLNKWEDSIESFRNCQLHKYIPAPVAIALLTSTVAAQIPDDIKQKIYATITPSLSTALEDEPDNGNMWLALSLINLQLEKTSEAIHDLGQAVTLLSNEITPLVFRGAAHAIQNRMDEALSDLHHALKIDPTSLSALNMMGGIQYKLNAFEKAREYFQQAKVIDQTDTNVLFGLGLTLHRLRLYAQAIEEYNQHLALSPGNTSVLLRRSQSRTGMRKYRLALDDFEAGRSNMRIDGLYWNEKGLLTSYLGDFENALECYDSGLQIEHEDGALLYNRAIVVSKINGFAAAADDITKAKSAIDAETDSAKRGSSLYRLAGFEAITGYRTEAAIEMLKEAIKLEPEAITWAEHDIAWENLRDHETFKEALLIRK